MRNVCLFLLALLSLVIFVSAATLPVHAQGKRLKVVASTTIIQDIARNVDGDKADVDFLVPTNGDVHAFEPKPEDVRKLADADMILVNGVGLERFIDKLITESGTKGKLVVVSRSLPIQKFQSFEGGNDKADPGSVLGISGSYECGAPTGGEEIGEWDPHLWQNVSNVIGYVLNIRDALD